MRNIKLIIEYDGTNYHGWQFQPEYKTIQSELEKALLKLTQQPVKLYCAGRTDTGVHALGNVVNFNTESKLALTIFEKGLNRFLPPDIRVMKAEEVPVDFHARYSAKYRRYRYVISTKRHAIERNFQWYCRYPINFELIRQASQYLIGTHDFQAFSKADPQKPNYLCNVRALTWEQRENRLIMEITANRFLHNMVRIIVGTMVEVSRGNLKPEQIPEILASRNRRLAGKTVPPNGLILLEVGY
ncbi:tRNA pseudouridine(38-40) synthase TruA [candidate division KSB1 bacterium]|nr:tRNA pseudouridine(38-40) synthase TruA [candidate division KSB1 bacterium]